MKDNRDVAIEYFVGRAAHHLAQLTIDATGAVAPKAMLAHMRIMSNYISDDALAHFDKEYNEYLSFGLEIKTT